MFIVGGWAQSVVSWNLHCFTFNISTAFNLNELLSPLFFHQHVFQSTAKILKCSNFLSMSSVFTQTILQSTLIPLYMSFNLHYFHSTLIIFSIEFNQRFKTSQLFFNLWPYFNLNCFSINCFTFSRLKMMLIEKQLMRLKSRYSQRIHVDLKLA